MSAKSFDLTTQIIAYESGELTDDETIKLFQHLVNTKLAWQLQGHYGRTATALLEQGLITQPLSNWEKKLIDENN